MRIMLLKMIQFCLASIMEELDYRGLCLQAYVQSEAGAKMLSSVEFTDV